MLCKDARSSGVRAEIAVRGTPAPALAGALASELLTGAQAPRARGFPCNVTLPALRASQQTRPARTFTEGREEQKGTGQQPLGKSGPHGENNHRCFCNRAGN